MGVSLSILQKLSMEGIHPTTNFIISRIISCKDAIRNDPKLVLGSYVKGANNKICREWAKRLGLSHQTVISHCIYDNRTEVNRACPRSLSPWYGLGGSGSSPFS